MNEDVVVLGGVCFARRPGRKTKKNAWIIDIGKVYVCMGN
jgi:hypothetical protein